jgi:phosphonate transport system permease protein
MSVIAARNASPHAVLWRLSRLVLCLIRALPELVWALVFVSALGLGAPPGVLAMAIVSVGFMARFYAESLEVVDPGVTEAIEAHGAGWVQVRLHGMFPQAMPDMVGTSLYLLDHNLRAATLLGLVGAGGIGYDMIVSLKLFRFDRLSLIILAIYAMIFVLDRVSDRIRRRIIECRPSQRTTGRTTGRYGNRPAPFVRLVYTLLVLGATAAIAWDLGLRPALLNSMVSDMGQYLSRYLHPDFSQWTKYMALLGQTLGIAAWGTALSFLISFCSAPLAARNFAPWSPLYHVVRHGQTFFRAMPDLLLALIFVSAIGLGPMPGIMALALHTSGFLGKFFAENLERVDTGNCEALRSSGAGYMQVLFYAGWPGTVRETIGYTLYIFDRNVRMAMVLGLVGAGGIGRTLHDALRVFKYDQASAIIILVLLTIFSIDLLSNWLRRKVQ